MAQEMKKDNPYLLKTDSGYVITPEGEEYLKKIVTSGDGQVYAFTKEAPPLLVAAAMARLSRSPNDLRVTYLNEFGVDSSNAESLIEKIVTEYGDDSVQQLMPAAVVVEGASNLLTKKLEWGRPAAYLEQSTRYIFYDELDRDGRHKYYVPEFPERAKDVLPIYREMMDDIFKTYSNVVRGVTDYIRKKNPEPLDKKERQAWLGATRAQACDAARPMLPSATKSTVGIVASAQALESLVIHLSADILPEAVSMRDKILKEARKVAGPFLKRADRPERGLAQAFYMFEKKRKLAHFSKLNLPVAREPVARGVRLIDYFPLDELDLVPEMLFETSGHSLAELKSIVARWYPFDKEKVFSLYMGERMNRRHKPGRALEKAHYEWEIVGDYGTFRDLQRHRMVDAWEWQSLKPYYGYDVPSLITEAGFGSQFCRCFEISEGLYNLFLQYGMEEEAEYAVLLGHLMRYRFILNARAAFHFHELRTGPQGHPGYRKIVQEMHDKLTEVHPRLGAAMKFVNMDEDAELTRLAAERVTQSKLAKLATSESDTLS